MLGVCMQNMTPLNNQEILLKRIEEREESSKPPSAVSLEMAQIIASKKILNAFRKYKARKELKNLKFESTKSVARESLEIKEPEKNEIKETNLSTNNNESVFSGKSINLINFTDTSSDEYRYENIDEFEGRLIVLEEIFIDRRNSYFVKGETPLVELVCKVAKETRHYNSDLKMVLTHKYFGEYFPALVETLKKVNASGVPQLFSFPKQAIIEILDAGIKSGHFSSQAMVPFILDLVIFSVDNDKFEVMDKVCEFFPDMIQSNAVEIIEKLMIKGQSASDVENLVARIGVKPMHYELWQQIAKRSPLDEKFYEDFSQLSPKHKAVLYQAAFAYNNPFLHEPADQPIKPEQYSVNVMWINKNKMPKEQEFLFGKGATCEERESDFKKSFIEPVSEWVKKNPGSAVNIWFDSEMAHPQAIERSQSNLLTALEGVPHGKIQFRDVRSIGVVSSNPSVFNERMPIYFRADLLRAIISDHILRSKETQYSVYADIDVKPQSANELFDKKTIHFLDDLGFVMAKGGNLGFENSFQIFNGNHEQALDSHRRIIIDLSVEMGNFKPNAIKEQQIYDTYSAMMTHLLIKDGRYGQFATLSRSLKELRYDRWVQQPVGSGGAFYLREIMPRKPVQVPPSRFG